MIETPLCLSRRLIIWWLVVGEQIDTSTFSYFMNKNIANMVNLCMSRHSVVAVWNFFLCTRHLHWVYKVNMLVVQECTKVPMLKDFKSF